MGEYGIKHGVKRLLLGHKIFYKITVGFRETHPTPRHFYVCYAKKNGGRESKCTIYTPACT